MSETGLILWHDYGRNDFLAEPENAWGVSKFLHELSDVGVRVLHGTSLGILALTAAASEALTARLLDEHVA